MSYTTVASSAAMSFFSVIVFQYRAKRILFLTDIKLCDAMKVCDCFRCISIPHMECVQDTGQDNGLKSTKKLCLWLALLCHLIKQI